VLGLLRLLLLGMWPLLFGSCLVLFGCFACSFRHHVHDCYPGACCYFSRPRSRLRACAFKPCISCCPHPSFWSHFQRTSGYRLLKGVIMVIWREWLHHRIVTCGVRYLMVDWRVSPFCSSQASQQRLVSDGCSGCLAGHIRPGVPATACL
jgi:hypothetical protein